MSLNTVILNGKLPHFDGTHKAAEGEKKAFLSWAVSVQRDYKPADAQYYPEDLINFKAFGPTADFINNYFKQGDGIVITGRLQRDEDYEKDGQTIKGQLSVLVEKAMFQAGKSGGSDGSDSAPAAKAPKAPGAGPKAPVGGAKKPPSKRPF